MKKVLSVLLVFLLALSTFACANANSDGKVSRGKNVSAIFSGIDKQPSGGSDEMVDTIWIYYDNGTFDQYAEIDKEMILFSQGNYHFENNGNFIDGQKDSSKGQIVINRNKKYQYGKGLLDYSSLHTYDLYALGFKCIWARE